MADRKTVLLLPGQGAQRERMAAGLYGQQPEFTACVTRLVEGLGADGDRLAAAWLRTAPNPAIDEADTAQPLLLMVGFALGMALSAEGRAPDLLLGHSVGELAAACLAGVFSRADIATVVTARARVLGADGRGGMLVVAAAPGELPAIAEPGVSVAAVNGPRQCVLAGPSAALQAVAASLRSAGLVARILKSDYAFHSAAMYPTAVRFRAELSRVQLRAPRTTLISTRTGTPVSPRQAVDPAFWADQIRFPVQYWPALKALLDSGPGVVLLDASADRSLTAGARHHPAVRSGASRIVPLLAPPRTTGGAADAAAFAAALDSLAVPPVR